MSLSPINSYWMVWRNNVLRKLEAKKMKLVSITIFIEQPHHLRQEPVFYPNGTHCHYDIWDLIWDVWFNMGCLVHLYLCFFYQLNLIII